MDVTHPAAVQMYYEANADEYRLVGLARRAPPPRAVERARMDDNARAFFAGMDVAPMDPDMNFGEDRENAKVAILGFYPGSRKVNAMGDTERVAESQMVAAALRFCKCWREEEAGGAETVFKIETKRMPNSFVAEEFRVTRDARANDRMVVQGWFVGETDADAAKAFVYLVKDATFQMIRRAEVEETAQQIADYCMDGNERVYRSMMAEQQEGTARRQYSV